jgi:hypothetical protein
VRRTLQTLAGLVVVVAGLTAASAPAYPEEDGRPAGPATFAAEVFATPSYHAMEIPKVEEGGEGFTWAYLNQQPESWGRALLFYSGSASEATFATSLPQQGPLTGHRWKAPGAWSSYPTGGESRGMADFGEPRVPLGTTVDTPGGTMQLLSFSGRASADKGVGEAAFGSFQSSVAPVRIGFARSFSSAAREEGAALSSGWAVARDVQIGDVSISEIRSDASVKATASGETGTWKLTITGVTVGEQRLEWTNRGVSFAPGSEAPLQQLNGELAKGAEGSRSEFQLVPGRVWRDDAGTHVQSGFLQMGHRPVILENSPGQKMSYALSVVSARALYRQSEAGVGLDDDLPAPAPEVPGPADASSTAAGAAGPGAVIGQPAVVLAPEPSVLLALSPVSEAYGTGGGLAGAGFPSATAEPPPGAVGEAALTAPATSGGPAGQARIPPALATGLGLRAAENLRGGIALMALAGAAAALAVLRAARRQLEFVGTSRGGG